MVRGERGPRQPFAQISHMGDKHVQQRRGDDSGRLDPQDGFNGSMCFGGSHSHSSHHF